jgi:hypothetical protein
MIIQPTRDERLSAGDEPLSVSVEPHLAQ